MGYRDMCEPVKGSKRSGTLLSYLYYYDMCT